MHIYKTLNLPARSALTVVKPSMISDSMKLTSMKPMDIVNVMKIKGAKTGLALSMLL